jgi:hypothetical protein
MSIFIETGFTGDTYPLTHGRVCWNWHNAGTIAASTEASGFAAENALPPRTDSAWRPTSLPGSAAYWVQNFATSREIGFIGIAKHDLGTQNATIQVQYKAVGAGSYTTYPGFSSIQPKDDSPLLFLVDPDLVDGFGINISAADDNPTISVIMGGIADEWPRPFVWTGQPITEGDRRTFRNNISMTGNWIGRSVQNDGLQFDLTMNNASETWRQGDFQDFKAYANGEDAAFFVAPRPGAYPDEVAYAWLTSVATASRERPNAANSTSVTLSCQGLRPYG